MGDGTTQVETLAYIAHADKVRTSTRCFFHHWDMDRDTGCSRYIHRYIHSSSIQARGKPHWSLSCVTMRKTWRAAYNSSASELEFVRERTKSARSRAAPPSSDVLAFDHATKCTDRSDLLEDRTSS